MSTETDVLQIVKQLRIYNFLLQHAMKPHQYSLVHWFDKYCMGLDDKGDTSSSSSSFSEEDDLAVGIEDFPCDDEQRLKDQIDAATKLYPQLSR